MAAWFPHLALDLGRQGLAGALGWASKHAVGPLGMVQGPSPGPSIACRHPGHPSSHFRTGLSLLGQKVGLQELGLPCGFPRCPKAWLPMSSSAPRLLQPYDPKEIVDQDQVPAILLLVCRVAYHHNLRVTKGNPGAQPAASQWAPSLSPLGEALNGLFVYPSTDSGPHALLGPFLLPPCRPFTSS